MKLDVPLLEHLDEHAADVIACHQHRLVLGRIEGQLRPLPDAPLAEQRVDEEGRFIRSSRAGVGRAADQDDDAAAGELSERVLDLYCPVPGVQVEGGLREARHRLGVSLGPQDDEDMVALEDAGRRAYGSGGRVDRLDLSANDFDAGTRQRGELALPLPRLLALTRHDPELGHAGGEGLVPFDQYDAMVRRRQSAQVAGHRDATDAAAEDQRRRIRHSGPLAVLSTEIGDSGR